MSKSAIVIGAGFSGLSAATCLAHAGLKVTLIEKNSQVGGRARLLEAEGFSFDMGPSWYWMPDVFEKYFALFGKRVSDYYQIKRLDPSYKVFFGEGDSLEVPAAMEELYELFESLEKNSSRALKKFLDEAAHKYKVGMTDLVYKPGISPGEFLNIPFLKGMFRLHVFQSFHGYIRRHFKHPKLLSLLEFPVLFLGAMPAETPALYSLMNYADMQLGTWYPEGGMNRIVKGMEALALSSGVEIRTGEEGKNILVENGRAAQFGTELGSYRADFFVAAADYHHVESRLLEKAYRNYDEQYWEKRTFAPSSLIFYLGVNKKLNKLRHHNLFFDEDFEQHAQELYKTKTWPEKPLFYVSAPSRTDATVAPEGHENLFILIPVAPGLEDDDALREKYYQLVLKRMEKLTGESILEHVVYRKSYAHREFIRDYHSYKGNAYGLANTLRQTAMLKPSIKNKKVSNLFYAGQLTVPGPGVPPALISGQLAASQIIQKINKNGR